jgi:hypothetical protein
VVTVGPSSCSIDVLGCCFGLNIFERWEKVYEWLKYRNKVLELTQQTRRTIDNESILSSSPEVSVRVSVEVSLRDEEGQLGVSKACMSDS